MNILENQRHLKAAIVLLATYLIHAPVSADIFAADATQASYSQALSISDTKNQWHNQVSAKGASLGLAFGRHSDYREMVQLLVDRLEDLSKEVVYTAEVTA